jgi:glycosyltransferase involved in cell wall biosynthesis
MKVLFVSSGNSKHWEIVPFIKSQGESLKRKGIDLQYYPIKGNGLKGYLGNVPRLRKKIRDFNPDVVHTHYSISGWVSLLANSRKPKVLSLMGSDTYGSVGEEGRASMRSRLMQAQVYFIQYFFKTIIVKSANLRESVWLKDNVYTIPNGVNYNTFKPSDQRETRKKLGLPTDKKLILFMGRSGDPRKNLALVQQALPLLETKDTELITPYPVVHAEVPLYLNACDVLVFPSFKEGSPNVIKEALACNTRIVATPSGDILERVEGIDSVWVSDFDAKDFAGKMDLALNYAKPVNSRELVSSEIDEDKISDSILNIYKKLISDQR